MGISNPVLEEPPAYFAEFGNSAGDGKKQTGQMKLSLQSLGRPPSASLGGSPVEVVFGVNGLYQTIRQKDVAFRGTSEPGSSLEIQTGLGAHIGFHGKGTRPFHGVGSVAVLGWGTSFWALFPYAQHLDHRRGIHPPGRLYL
jgi:hypothetical protein